jgi:hypothetical protein
VALLALRFGTSPRQVIQVLAQGPLTQYQTRDLSPDAKQAALPGLLHCAVPPEEEFEIIRKAGLGLTTDPKSVSVRLVETEEYPLIILEFVMKNQAQYKVVNEISDDVQRWLGNLFNTITTQFHQTRKKSRPR